MEMALSMRRQRIEHKDPGYQHALIGAEAIHYEMEALGIRPTPPVRTIHYWLKRAGLMDEPHPEDASEKEPKPYPTPKREAVND